MRILLFRSKISRMFLWEFYLKSIYRSLTILIFHLKTQLRNKSIQINDQSTTSIIIYNLELILLNNLYIRGQFHQRFTSSFCACRSRKRKKDLQLDCLFCTFGICTHKAAGRTLMKLSPAVLIFNVASECKTSIYYWRCFVQTLAQWPTVFLTVKIPSLATIFPSNKWQTKTYI